MTNCLTDGTHVLLWQENVLPSTATAIINHRIHPSQTVEEIIAADRRVINDDRISIEALSLPIQPHPISRFDDDAVGYQTIKKSVHQVYPGTVVVPWVMLASTDTRWSTQ